MKVIKAGRLEWLLLLDRDSIGDQCTMRQIVATGNGRTSTTTGVLKAVETGRRPERRLVAASIGNWNTRRLDRSLSRGLVYQMDLWLGLLATVSNHNKPVVAAE
jgi:hypothetical protein